MNFKWLPLLVSVVLASPSMAQTMEERFEGSILGVYLGDALGKGCEIVYKDNPESAPITYRERRILKLEAREDNKEDGYYKGRDKHQLPGTYTDDTEETLGLLTSILEKKKFDSEHQSKRIAQFYKPAHGYSRSTGELLTYIADAKDSATSARNRFFKTRAVDRVYRDSNGCSMRIAPIALLHRESSADDLKRIIYSSCDVTHPGIAPKEASYLMAYGIRWALTQNGFDSKAFINAVMSQIPSDADLTVENYKKYYEPGLLELASKGSKQAANDLIKKNLVDLKTLYANIKMIPSLLSQNLSVDEETKYLRKNFGVTYETAGSVPTSLYIVARYGNDIQLALNAAAHISLAGDTDTIPAMAGSILGALHGVRALPKVWMDQLFREDDSWRMTAGYVEGYSESLVTPSGEPTYLSWLKVQEMAKQLFAIYKKSGSEK